jgi:hypothetical protein
MCSPLLGTCCEGLKPLTEFILGEEALLYTSLNGYDRAPETRSAQARNRFYSSGNRPDLIEALGLEGHYDCAGEVQKDRLGRHKV